MIYPIRLVIPATEGSFPPFDVEVGGVVPNTPDTDVMIGNDILKCFTFTYRGPQREFTLSLEERSTTNASSS